MDVLDRVYYTRAVLGVIAGVIAGLEPMRKVRFFYM